MIEVVNPAFSIYLNNYYKNYLLIFLLINIPYLFD